MEIKGIKRNRAVYTVLRILLGWLICALRCFSYEYKKTNSKTALILANHNSDWDPMMIVVGLRRHMKFVASANILGGFTGAIINFLVAPIPRHKGASADDTVALIGENLKAGVSVAMFPEGNKSWDGRTCYISPRTASLLKESGCGLITYRLDGDYLQTPRWAIHKRRGPVKGSVVREYLPEELAEMSQEEIYEAMVRDLDVNAFDYQKEHKLEYKGKDKAEGFENMAWLCPKCRKISTIRTSGDEISCSCGLHMRYNNFGFLDDLNGTETSERPGLKQAPGAVSEPPDPKQTFCASSGLPSNAFEWNRIQKDYLFSHADNLRSQTLAPICVDENCTVTGKLPSGEKIELDGCTVRTYGDRIEILPETEAGPDRNAAMINCPWTSIHNLGMFRNTTVYITSDAGRLKIGRRSGIAGLRYFSFWRVLTGKVLY